ncbi:50S ribosomal protein L4 [Candidatus Woesearchaeota archaeon]|nr:50S ribosomal protein L4 [Candidatus Woesearchaeota archaeon]
MKVDVLGLDGKKLSSIELPIQFTEEYEPGLVNRAKLAIFSHLRQPYGTMPRAGKNYSAKLSRRRRNYKGSYGKGISRVPRKTMWRRGMQFGWVGALISSTVGGRRAHPPKASKNWELKINVKERRKAIRSALSGIQQQNKLTIIDSKFESIKVTKDVKKVLETLGFDVDGKKIFKAGRGKSRGRAVRYKKNPLVVVTKNCDVVKALNNLPGYDTIDVKSLNAHLLSLNYNLPRACIFTKNALETMDKEKLFIGVKK